MKISDYLITVYGPTDPETISRFINDPEIKQLVIDAVKKGGGAILEGNKLTVSDGERVETRKLIGEYDKTIADCREKFDNIEKYGGFPGPRTMCPFELDDSQCKVIDVEKAKEIARQCLEIENIMRRPCLGDCGRLVPVDDALCEECFTYANSFQQRSVLVAAQARLWVAHDQYGPGVYIPVEDVEMESEEWSEVVDQFNKMPDKGIGRTRELSHTLRAMNSVTIALIKELYKLGNAMPACVEPQCVCVNYSLNHDPDCAWKKWKDNALNPL